VTRQVSLSFIIFVLMVLAYGVVYFNGFSFEFPASHSGLKKAPVVERIPASEAWSHAFVISK
jgi:hypothetical protein